MKESTTDLHSMATLRDAIEMDLQEAFADLEGNSPPELKEMIHYHLGWKDADSPRRGKRVRPMLTLLSCAAVDGQWRQALPVASSIELIHNFSLIHDDIQDRSEMRRGRETVWKLWGVPRAINVGDALFVLSRMSVARLDVSRIHAERVLRIMHALDQACLNLTIGQELDLSFEKTESVSVEDYLWMIQCKTAALISAATSSGGIIAGARDEEIAYLFDFGHHLGMSFQIQDDLLGIWGTPSVTGKSSADDLSARKKTLPILYGLRRSPRFQHLWASERYDDLTLSAMREELEEVSAKEFSMQEASKHMKASLAALASIASEQLYYQELRELAHKLLNRDN
jgi:geranylgeranyl diphosphate synthase type I